MERKSMKKLFIAFTICMCIVFRIGFVVNAGTNPISVTATPVENGIFMVVLRAEPGTDMQAFKLIIKYNADKVAVAGEKGKAYGFASDFLSSYHANSSAALVYNNIVQENNARLIYAGAQADADKALLKQGKDICFVQFEWLGESSNVMQESGITVKVEQLKGADGDLVARYPNDFTEILLANVMDEVAATDAPVADNEVKDETWQQDEGDQRNVENNTTKKPEENKTIEKYFDTAESKLDDSRKEQMYLTGESLLTGNTTPSAGNSLPAVEITGENIVENSRDNTRTALDVTDESLTSNRKGAQDSLTRTDTKQKHNDQKPLHKWIIITMLTVMLMIIAAVTTIIWKKKGKSA